LPVAFVVFVGSLCSIYVFIFSNAARRFVVLLLVLLVVVVLVYSVASDTSACTGCAFRNGNREKQELLLEMIQTVLC